MHLACAAKIGNILHSHTPINATLELHRYHVVMYGSVNYY